MRNTLVHVRNVDKADWKRMADHNIYATAGMHWHNLSDAAAGEMKGLVPEFMEHESYSIIFLISSDIASSDC